MTAIGIINFGDDIFPSLIKWINFFDFTLEFVKHIRDFILIPITYPIRQIFNLILLNWYKSYLFIGLLFLNTFNFSHSKICKSPSTSSLIMLCFGKERWKVALMILLRVFLWPIFIYELISHYIKGHYKRKHNVYTLWGKYIFWVTITTIIMIFLNWIWIKFSIAYNTSKIYT
ncbi:MAG TPA: hypothetical protein DER05_11695 [Lutibacter sp.]|nr:hypothetical protein [Lutibacter sp.]